MARVSARAFRNTTKVNRLIAILRGAATSRPRPPCARTSLSFPLPSLCVVFLFFFNWNTFPVLIASSCASQGESE